MKKSIGSIDCKSTGELMFDYLDGELSQTETWSLEAHISRCEDCKKELEERKNMLGTVKLTAENPPSELKSGVMKKIENIPQEKSGWSFKPSARLTSILAAACVVIMVAVGFRGFLFSGVTTGDTPAGNGDTAVQAGDIPTVNVASARSFDTYAQIPQVQDYSDTPASVLDVKTQGTVITDGEKSASEAGGAELDKIYDCAVEVVGENVGVVVGFAESFEELIADVPKSEMELGGVMYDFYTVTDNCTSLVGQFQRGELATGKPWRAHLPSGTEITEIRFIIIDK